MTEPTDLELLELATPYALDAVTDDERAAIERLLAAAPSAVADAFRREVRAVRETMSVLSASTALEPPEHLRTQVLAVAKPKRQFPWRTTLLAAAAALVIGLGAAGAVLALRPTPTPSTPEQVLAAPDVHTVSGQMPGGGTATVIFSRDKNAGVLVMNNVPKPQTRDRVPDVVDQRPRPRFRGDHGRSGRLIVDDGCAPRPAALNRAGIHGRTRYRLGEAHTAGHRPAVAHLSHGAIHRQASQVLATVNSATRHAAETSLSSHSAKSRPIQCVSGSE